MEVVPFKEYSYKGQSFLLIFMLRALLEKAISIALYLKLVIILQLLFSLKTRQALTQKLPIITFRHGRIQIR